MPEREGVRDDRHRQGTGVIKVNNGLRYCNHIDLCRLT